MISPGTRLGPYEITGRLGEGGMGEVYRATDSKLKREVAIKVLPAAFTEDRDRLARFEREAQLLAQLQHPNIASIYGLEDSEGGRALVMELVDGPTLAERLGREGLALEDCLTIARQIAEALEEAHEKGIIHRDLKPQNIKAPLDGQVKVLDFGLAKAMDPVGAASSAESVSQLAASPTLTLGATVQGMILGTAAYMAPEQAKGVVVDKRADIWAFGVVLYEMLTGTRLFAGDSVPETLAGVLKSEIDFSALPKNTPPPLHRLVRRCLERNPRNRLHDIADARLMLEDITNGVGDAPFDSPPAPSRATRREVIAWVVALGLAAVAAVLLQGRESAVSPGPRMIQSTLAMPPGVSIEFDGERSGMPVLSPDGRRIAFGARQGAGPMSIWVRDLASGESRELPGTEGGSRPFWSPDGKVIGFFTWGHLVTIPAEGGAVTTLAPARDSRGGTWSPNGTIVFSPHYKGTLQAISDRGGEPTEATGAFDVDGEVTHRYPHFLPDGEHFLYLERLISMGSRTGSGILVGRLGSTEPVARILEGNTNVIYQDGYLLFVRDGTLMAQPFDPKKLELFGVPQPLVQDVLFNERFSFGVFSVAGGEILAYLTGSQSNLSQLVWRSREGRRLGELGTPGVLSGHGGLALSPDGRWAAVSRVEEGGNGADIWIYDLEGGNETKLARPGSDEFDPIFDAEGRTLYFGLRERNYAAILRRELLTGVETEIYSTQSGVHLEPMSVSADGEWIVATKRPLGHWGDQVGVPVGGGEIIPLQDQEADEVNGQLSPDGNWLAYSSDTSGRYEVFVEHFPKAGSPVQISRSGGVQPRWNATGDELFFKTPDNMLTVLPIDTGSGTISVGTPKPLFQVTEFYGWTYAVAKDGEHILVREPLTESDASPITLLTDWIARLEPR